VERLRMRRSARRAWSLSSAKFLGQKLTAGGKASRNRSIRGMSSSGMPGPSSLTETSASFGRRTLAVRIYDTRHAAKVANAVSGVRSGLRVNSKAETFSNWT